HSFPQYSQHADRERDIRWRGDGPPSLQSGVARHRQVKKCRRQDPACRGHQGHHGLPEAAEGSVMELAANLQSHHEKEDAHQPVVHPPAERRVVTRPLPEDLVRGSPRRVGPAEGGGGGEQQHHAARGLHFEETPEPASPEAVYCRWPHPTPGSRPGHCAPPIGNPTSLSVISTDYIIVRSCSKSRQSEALKSVDRGRISCCGRADIGGLERHEWRGMARRPGAKSSARCTSVSAARSV